MDDDDHTADLHVQNIHRLCRVCAYLVNPPSKKKKGSSSGPVSANLIKPLEYKQLFGIDLNLDQDALHPKMVCRSCYGRVSSFRRRKITPTFVKICQDIVNDVWTEFDLSTSAKDCKLCKHVSTFSQLKYQLKRRKSDNKHLTIKYKHESDHASTSASMLSSDEPIQDIESPLESDKALFDTSPTPSFNQTAVPTPSFQPVLPSPSFQQSALPSPSIRQSASPLTSFQQSALPSPSFQQSALPSPSFQQSALPSPSFQQSVFPSPSFQQSALPSPSFQQSALPSPSFRQSAVHLPSFQQQTLPIPYFETTLPVDSDHPSALTSSLLHQSALPSHSFQQAAVPPSSLQQATLPSNSLVSPQSEVPIIMPSLKPPSITPASAQQSATPQRRLHHQYIHDSVDHTTPPRHSQRGMQLSPSKSPLKRGYNKLRYDLKRSSIKDVKDSIDSLDKSKRLKIASGLITALMKEEGSTSIELPTGGSPFTIERQIKARKQSSEVSRETLRRRSKKMSKTRHIVAGKSNEANAVQQLAEINNAPKVQRDYVRTKLRKKYKVVINKKWGTKLQQHGSFSFSQMRKIRQFFRPHNVFFEGEQSVRKYLQKILPATIEVKHLLFDFPDPADPSDKNQIKRLAPLLRIGQLVRFVKCLITAYHANGLLKWRAGMPTNQIWVKLGADHGRDSFKVNIQIANVESPNSKLFTVMVGYAKVKDTPENLKLIFDEFKDEIRDLQTAVWEDKTIQVFLTGDYSFLANIYGLSGAAGTHFCLWCEKTLAEMRSTTSNKKAKQRDLEKMKKNYKDFISKGKGKKKASAAKCKNVVREPCLNIPISNVVPPSLHILLGVVKKHHDFIEMGCDEIDTDIIDETLNKRKHHQSGTPKLDSYIDKLKEKRKMALLLFRHKKILKKDTIQSKDEISKLIKQIDNALSKIRKEIYQLKKKKYPSRTGPVARHLDEILKQSNIELQAYHGRSFVGNHCVKYITEDVTKDLAMGIIEKTCEHTDSDKIRAKSKRLAQKLISVNSAFCTIYGHLSHCNAISEDEYLELKRYTKAYMKYYRRHLSRVYPKLHFLEEHCLEWIGKYRLGMGLFSEHGCEQLHKSIRVLELQSHGIANKVERMSCVLKKHLMQVAPELISLMPSTKKRPRQKKTKWC